MTDDDGERSNPVITHGDANAEKSVVWARYNALLVAVTFVGAMNSAFFLSDIEGLPPFLLATSGALISLFWMIIHCVGYRTYRHYRGQTEWSKRKTLDWVFVGSVSVIATFTILFLLLVGYQIIYVFNLFG